jgi:hypothetical protein
VHHRLRLTAIAAAAFSLVAAVGVVGASGGAQAAPSQPTLVTANPADFTPHVMDGQVRAIVQVGSTIVLGGQFTSVQNSAGTRTFTRTNLVAFNALTGAVSTAFRSAPNGVVEALAVGGANSVYVAGAFTSVDGRAASRLTKLNLNNGARVGSFNPPSVSGPIRDMKVVGGRLYLSGSFSTVGNQPRSRMATLDAVTGGLTDALDVSFTGTNNGGVTTVSKFAVSPNGSRLVAIGNFAAVDGQPRGQIAMLDTSGPTATLTDWSTDLYPNACASVFNTYMRDLDFSPNGSYFIVSTTGAYGGPDSLCDTITRWPTAATGGGQQPSWIAHTGGDTTYAVTATGTAVYAGGHMRWLNNPYAGDAPGPGAVPRAGIVALDPRTGLPFSWNPGRSRGVGVFDMLATSQGLWVGSDTSRIGGETHRRIALMPLAGGATVPSVTTPKLPGTVLQLGRLATATDPSVLYRVNAGGPELLSVDDGPDWAADSAGASPYRNSGSETVEAWNQSVSRDASVPSSDADRAPQALFDSERWDPGSAGDGEEMQWSFPVTSGTPVRVRLYFANQCGCTSGVGDRVFDVAVDGTTKLSSFDLVAAKGDRVGFVKSFDVTSDGSLDLAFTHVTENPLVNGIEIIDRSVPAGTTGNPAADQVDATPLASSGTAGTTVTRAGTEAWSGARGAFVVNSVLYTPWRDGTLRARTIAPKGSLGTSRTVNLYDGSFGTDASNVTGIAFDPATRRIYYTMAGRSQLFWRWFQPQSEIVGAVRFEVDGGALDPAQVRGMFLSGSTLYFAQRGSGDLSSVPFDAGVAGPATLVNSTRDWVAPAVTLRAS